MDEEQKPIQPRTIEQIEKELAHIESGNVLVIDEAGNVKDEQGKPVEIVRKKCLHCGMELIGPGARKLYCSTKCRTRHNSKMLYHSKKSDPEYMAKRSLYFKSWVAKNRAHFNELVKKSYHRRKGGVGEVKTDIPVQPETTTN
jgi:hypothetical protein